MDKKAILERLGDFGPLYQEIISKYKPTGKGQALGLCPFHKDHSPSLSMNTATGLFNCKACGEKGGPVDLLMKAWNLDFKSTLERLAERAGITKETKPHLVASFPYTDADGKRLYWKERWEPGREGRSKEFFFYHQGKSGKAKGRGGDPVLYRLHEIITAEKVYFTEGEAKADKLADWGLVATCLDSGAQSGWKDSYTPHLEGKQIVIVPDNDTPGQEYVQRIAKALHGKAKSLKVLRLPGLPEKGDVLDWIEEEGNDKAHFLELAAEAPDWTPAETVPEPAGKKPPRRDPASSASPESKGERGIERLLPMLLAFPLLRDATGRTYIEIDDRLEPLDTRNPALTSHFLYLYYITTGKHISKEAVNACIMILSAKARREAPLVELFNRVGVSEGRSYYDLKNGRVVEVSAGSWSITKAAPVRWHTFNHQLPQPDPTPGGDVFRFFDFCNVSEDSRLMVAVVIVSCFIPRISHPALHITGCQGAGKSFFSKLLKQITDPSVATLLTMPRKDEDFDLLLFRHHFVPLDNLSDLSPSLSDRLCNVITGAVLEKRLLFTDTDTALLPCNPVVAFNGITPLIKRADLLDRSITITLERITPDKRREERELWRDFEASIPSILGGVFDTLSRAMEIFPDVNLKNLPRLADFARWGFAIAEALGGRGNEFLRAYADNSAMQTADLHESNTFLAAIVTRMEEHGHLEGNFKEVLEILTLQAQPGKNDRTFPASPRAFRGHLERIRVPLADMGITYSISDPEERTRRGRIVSFEKTETAPEAAAWSYVDDGKAPF